MLCKTWHQLNPVLFNRWAVVKGAAFWHSGNKSGTGWQDLHFDQGPRQASTTLSFALLLGQPQVGIKLAAWLSWLCCLHRKTHASVLACSLNSNPLSMQLHVQLKDVQELMISMRFLDPAKRSRLSCFSLSVSSWCGFPCLIQAIAVFFCCGCFPLYKLILRRTINAFLAEWQFTYALLIKSKCIACQTFVRLSRSDVSTRSYFKNPRISFDTADLMHCTASNLSISYSWWIHYLHLL